MTYDIAIDMWSFGCIIAELYLGYPLFPGENELEQLAYIMELLGVPSNAYISVHNINLYKKFRKARDFQNFLTKILLLR